MSVHNEKEEHLRLAVDSICKQTYDNIEFIIIDDASNDVCKKVLNSLSITYANIKLILNSVNIGLTASLNKGLSEASGEYIARMDADDYSTPDRIAKQVKFLDQSNDVDICGTGVISFGETRVYMSPHAGLDNKKAQCMLFYSSTLCHPSVMIRKTFLDRYKLTYDETVRKGQDYDMWERCSVYGKFAILDEVLLYYRTHKSQISCQNRDDQDCSANMVRLRRLNRLGIIPTQREQECHLSLIKSVNTDITKVELQAWIKKLIEANKSINLVDAVTFENDLNIRYILFCIRRKDFSFIYNVKLWGYLVYIAWNRMIISFKLIILRDRINDYVFSVKA